MRTRDLIPVFLVLALGACAHSAQPAPPSGRRATIAVTPLTGCEDTLVPRVPSFRASDTLSLEAAQRFYPQAAAWLARRVPGGWSGGPWRTNGGQPLRLYLRDPAQQHAALAVLDTLAPRVLELVRPRPTDTVVVLPVQWDAAEVYDWYRYISDRVRTLTGPPGVNMLGMDQAGGRIVVGVEFAESLPGAIRWLQSLNVPCNLVYLEVSGTIQLTPSSQQPTAKGQQPTATSD